MRQFRTYGSVGALGMKSYPGPPDNKHFEAWQGVSHLLAAVGLTEYGRSIPLHPTWHSCPNRPLV